MLQHNIYNKHKFMIKIKYNELFPGYLNKLMSIDRMVLLILIVLI